MGRIKEKSAEKISKSNILEKVEMSKCPKHPVFCFKYMTKNKAYNMDFYNRKQNNLRKETCFELYNKLIEIGAMNWLMLNGLGRENGIETIPIYALKFCPNDEDKELGLTKDEKFISIRFGQGNGKRIIGIKRDGCSTLNVIGFDLDYSAYDHG